MYHCALCRVQACDKMDPEAMPKSCPSKSVQDREDIREEYLKEENFLFGKVCSYVSMSVDGYVPRIVEFIQVAKGCGFKKIGLAFCVGFCEEARMLTQVLEYHGFSVTSVICKVGGVDKNLHGIENGGNAMCNPIAQAKLLNEEHTDMNIALGLCVGHDSLFFKYSEAPVTVLAAKDKMLGHNPMAALYLSQGYYKHILFPPKP